MNWSILFKIASYSASYLVSDSVSCLVSYSVSYLVSYFVLNVVHAMFRSRSLGLNKSKSKPNNFGYWWYFVVKHEKQKQPTVGGRFNKAYHANLQKALFKSQGLHVQMDQGHRISTVAVQLTWTWSITECFYVYHDQLQASAKETFTHSHTATILTEYPMGKSMVSQWIFATKPMNIPWEYIRFDLFRTSPTKALDLHCAWSLQQLSPVETNPWNVKGKWKYRNAEMTVPSTRNLRKTWSLSLSL